MKKASQMSWGEKGVNATRTWGRWQVWATIASIVVSIVLAATFSSKLSTADVKADRMGMAINGAKTVIINNGIYKDVMAEPISIPLQIDQHSTETPFDIKHNFSISLSFFMKDYDNAWPTLIFAGEDVAAIGIGVVGKSSGTPARENIGTLMTFSESGHHGFNWFLNSHFSVPLGQTNTLVFVKVERTVKLYLNKQLIGDTSVDQDYYPYFNGIVVGKGKNADSYFHGYITNVKVYTNALSETEIVKL